MLQKLDEILLLEKKFEYGLSGTTLWGTDRNNRQWCCVLDSPGDALLWSPVRENGGLDPQRPMSRQEFGELFNYG